MITEIYVKDEPTFCLVNEKNRYDYDTSYQNLDHVKLFRATKTESLKVSTALLGTY
jgi:hypothetical protein